MLFSFTLLSIFLSFRILSDYLSHYMLFYLTIYLVFLTFSHFTLLLLLSILFYFTISQEKEDGKDVDRNSPKESATNTPRSTRTPCSTFENEHLPINIFDKKNEWKLGIKIIFNFALFL